jgi:hypothetical protein
MIKGNGPKCPLNWDKLPTNYRWLAVDADGEIYAYENKPRVMGRPYWRAIDREFWFLGKTNPPESFRQCLWQRPKSESE